MHELNQYRQIQMYTIAMTPVQYTFINENENIFNAFRFRIIGYNPAKYTLLFKI